MSENLTYYLDENTKLKNGKKAVITSNVDEMTLTESGEEENEQALTELTRLSKELTRFKRYVNNNFI